MFEDGYFEIKVKEMKNWNEAPKIISKFGKFIIKTDNLNIKHAVDFERYNLVINNNKIETLQDAHKPNFIIKDGDTKWSKLEVDDDFAETNKALIEYYILVYSIYKRESSDGSNNTTFYSLYKGDKPVLTLLQDEKGVIYSLHEFYERGSLDIGLTNSELLQKYRKDIIKLLNYIKYTDFLPDYTNDVLDSKLFHYKGKYRGYNDFDTKPVYEFSDGTKIDHFDAPSLVIDEVLNIYLNKRSIKLYNIVKQNKIIGRFLTEGKHIIMQIPYEGKNAADILPYIIAYKDVEGMTIADDDNGNITIRPSSLAHMALEYIVNKKSISRKEFYVDGLGKKASTIPRSDNVIAIDNNLNRLGLIKNIEIY